MLTGRPRTVIGATARARRVPAVLVQDGSMVLDSCDIPVVLAPLAGGPSTPELAAAVSNAGGLGFLAAGYLSAADVAGRRRRLTELTSRPFGVNVFVPGPAGDVARVRQFAAEIESDVSAAGARLGETRHDDDGWDAKIEYLTADPVDVVSFTFGIPGEDVIAGLRARGSEVWVTVTSLDEASRAAAAGADLLVVQGYEAGGHRGGASDAPEEAIGLIALLQLVTARLATPVVAAGGLATGSAIAAALCLGARGAALGTAFLDCPQAHRRCTGPRCTAAPRPGSPGRSAAGPPAASRTASCALIRHPPRPPIPRCTTSPRRCGRRPARPASAIT
jgi:nitronate monooxygenase